MVDALLVSFFALRRLVFDSLKRTVFNPGFLFSSRELDEEIVLNESKAFAFNNSIETRANPRPGFCTDSSVCFFFVRRIPGTGQFLNRTFGRGWDRLAIGKDVGLSRLTYRNA